MASHRPFVSLQGGQPKGIFRVYPCVGICSARGLRVRARVKGFPSLLSFWHEQGEMLLERVPTFITNSDG